jgi:hypothetical protein
MNLNIALFADVSLMLKIFYFNVLNFYLVFVTLICYDFVLNPNKNVRNFRDIKAFLSIVLSNLRIMI